MVADETHHPGFFVCVPSHIRQSFCQCPVPKEFHNFCLFLPSSLEAVTLCFRHVIGSQGPSLQEKPYMLTCGLPSL